MKKLIIFIVTIVIIVFGSIWAKGYYNNRYVASETYYTQVPLNEDNKTSWLLDGDGAKQEKGKEYKLRGFDKNGREKEVSFTKKGSSSDYFTPGTYIKVNSSKTLDLGVDIISESNVPQKSLDNIKKFGTQKD